MGVGKFLPQVVVVHCTQAFKPELAVLFNSVQKRIQQPYMGIDSYVHKITYFEIHMT
jgi:hypothetical protein